MGQAVPLDDLPMTAAKSLPYNSPTLDAHAAQLEQHYGLPTGILRSIKNDGERSNGNQVSPKGAAGVMQFMPATAKEYGLSDPTDPASAMDAAARYLVNAKLVTGSDDPAILAAAYNSGMNRASLKNGIVPNIPETKAYADRVQGGIGKYAAPASKLVPADDLPTPSAKPTQMAKPSPVGTDGDNFFSGMGKMVADTGTGIAKSAADMLSNAPASLPLLRGLGAALAAAGASPAAASSDLSNQIQETRKLDKPLMDTKAGMGGYVAGGLATAPFLPSAQTAKGAAVVGAGLGAIQPAIDGKERAINTLLSAGSSGVGQAVVNRLASIVSPNVSPNVQALMKEGVTPTPGQIMGGGYKRAEEALTSVPVIGDAIKAGQNRAIGELNTAAMNRALSPVGESLPKNLKGRDAVEYVGDTLSRKYQDLLPKMTTRADGAFKSEITNLREMATSGNMGEAEAAQLSKIIDNKVLSKFGGQDAVTGQTLKGIESDLNNLAGGYRRDPSFDKQQLGNALTEVQSSLRDLISRNNPQYAKELQQANTGWANFKRVQRAAAGVGSDEGAFTAPQLQSAVKALDPSKDKGAFAKGDALMQDLAEPAKSVLAPKVNDSGTPLRSMMALLATAGAGTAAHLSPLGWAATLGGAAAAPIMYSRPGQNAIAALLTKRPDAAPAVANGLRSLLGPAALGVSPAIANGVKEKIPKSASGK
jgi:hypothetical protein